MVHTLMNIPVILTAHESRIWILWILGNKELLYIHRMLKRMSQLHVHRKTKAQMGLPLDS